MINITFDNLIYEISDGLLKLSESIKYLYDGREYETEPIPLHSCNEKIYEMFIEWFNDLNDLGIVEIPKFKTVDGKEHCLNFSYGQKILEKYNIDELVSLLNFAFANQIDILINTLINIVEKRLKTGQSVELCDLFKLMITNRKITYGYNPIVMKILDMPGLTISELINNDYISIYNGKYSFKGNKSKDKSHMTFIQVPKDKTIKEYVFPIVEKTRFKFVMISDCQDENTLSHLFYGTFYGLRSVLDTHDKSKDGFLIDNYFLGIAKDLGYVNFLKSSNGRYKITNSENFKSFMKKFCGNEDLINSIAPQTKEAIIINKTLYRAPNFGFKIPSCVKKICSGSFACCDNTSVEIPEGVEFIGSYAFKHCTNLKEIKISNSVKPSCGSASDRIIKKAAFSDCKNLIKVEIPKHLYRDELFKEYTITEKQDINGYYVISLYHTLYHYLNRYNA